VPPILQAKGLTKRYGPVTALDSAEFEVGEGITGLLGSNGAGKSTAIKLFLGILSPTAGTAEVLGKEASKLPSQVSAAEFLTHMAEVSGLPPSHARTRAADTLRHVGLFEERYRPMGGYSTGMKQRVKLAQALVHDPVLAMLDEPTAGLDPTGREEMLSLIRKVHKEFGISLLLSTHIMGDVERTCDQIIVLDAGRVSQQGDVRSFTQETETVFIEVSERVEELLRALQARGVRAHPDGAGVAVELAREAEYDSVRDALVESGAPLRRLAPRRHALTDLFQRPK
jgi:ABC-2 type transport system ATP-binding protein